MKRKIESKEEFAVEFMLYRDLHRHKKPDIRKHKLYESEIRRLYLIEKMSRPQIAEEYGCSLGTLDKFMKEKGIRRK